MVIVKQFSLLVPYENQLPPVQFVLLARFDQVPIGNEPCAWSGIENKQHAIKANVETINNFVAIVVLGLRLIGYSGPELRVVVMRSSLQSSDWGKETQR
jgi:hypothetical protein